MASPITKAGFPDLLDPRMREITYDTFQLQKDMVGYFYEMAESTQDPERGSDITPMGDMSEFTGTISFDGPDQAYDWLSNPREFALGMQIERRVWEYDQFGIIDKMFTRLGNSAHRTRQKHAARVFNNSFSDDTYFYDTTENVALCSNSHTTTRSGVSTATGFDNLSTDGLTPTALGAAITQFRKFKDLAGERINVLPDLLVVPVDLRDRALEIVKTASGLDSAEGTVNVYNSDYNFKVLDWVYLTDVNDWWLCDSRFMKNNLTWFERVPVEFARVEAFDEILAKYRAYMMYTIKRGVWQWVNGSQVS